MFQYFTNIIQLYFNLLIFIQPLFDTVVYIQLISEGWG